jgi:hypothetical protein
VPERTRRSVLAVSVAALPLLAGGCKGVGALGTPPRPGPDVAAARRAIGAEMAMIGRYEAVLGAVPGLGDRLRPLLHAHRDHLARLRAVLVVPAGVSAQPARPATEHQPRVPATGPAALGYLAGAERAASARLLAELRAAPPSFAQLLASIAACEASHALLLGPGGSG